MKTNPLQCSYDVSWVGIDAGREGLWREPIWSRVIEIIGQHEGEMVYDPNSPIYARLMHEFPDEKWCSLTPEKRFRPLFRDYSHPWTRTKVISLQEQKFWLTPLGHRLLKGEENKQNILIELFVNHAELNHVTGATERPFVILAQALAESPRPLTCKEIYWAVMKNYRPPEDSFDLIFHSYLKTTPKSIPDTPYRRVRHMLNLMRAADAVESYVRNSQTFWGVREHAVLKKIYLNAN